MPPKYSRELRQPVAHGPRLKEQFRTSPCEAACPAGTSIQKMQALAERRVHRGPALPAGQKPLPRHHGPGLSALLHGRLQPQPYGRLRQYPRP